MSNKVSTPTTAISVESAKQYANMFLQSGLAASDANLAEICVQIMTGSELGITPMASLQAVKLIGKAGRKTPAFSTNFLAQRIKQHPDYNYIVQESTDVVCRIMFYHRWNGEVFKSEEVFTKEMAIQAGLWVSDEAGQDWKKAQSPWFKFREAMLFNRCLSAGARKHCPDAMSLGLTAYMEEEIQAVEDAKATKPVETVDPAKIEGVEANQWTEPPLYKGVHATLGWAKDMTGMTLKEVNSLYESVEPDQNGKKALGFVALIRQIWERDTIEK